VIPEPIWFILYDGNSDDGRGFPTFYKRTTDIEVAKEHWKKCKSDPYSNGAVVAITDSKEIGLYFNEDWEKLKMTETS